MDTVLWVLTTLWDNAELVLQVAGGIVIVASLFVAGTKTPAPDTVLGRIYRAIEWLALVVGRAKDPGTNKQ